MNKALARPPNTPAACADRPCTAENSASKFLELLNAAYTAHGAARTSALTSNTLAMLPDCANARLGEAESSAG